MIREFLCRTEADAVAAGQEIAHLLPKEGLFYLIGDLGAGKTFLIRAIATELGANPLEVASPTFAIVHEYPIPAGPPIIHIDGYRLSDSRREWMEIGIPETLRAPGLKFVEWPKRPFEDFAEKAGQIEILVNPDESRRITLTL